MCKNAQICYFGIEAIMNKNIHASSKLAAAITKRASQQSYYTIRWFVDRDRVQDAYRAYAYFRWVDDVIDEKSCAWEARTAFAERQRSLLAACYEGLVSGDLCAEEWMLADLVQRNPGKDIGLYIYLWNMMEVMAFDARRRGRLISQTELAEYSHKLAKAVTEALYFFIGHEDPPLCQEVRYLAVTAAHITHMLRDALEDVDNGYYNIPGELISRHGLSRRDITSPVYREWVRSRVKLARQDFKLGRECTSRVKNLRCRLAGFAYIARFEWMLDTIERDQYCLRSEYPERKSLRTGLWMVWSTLAAMFASLRMRTDPHDPATGSVRLDGR
jgi:phytoene/squalene synthetase